MYSVAPLPPVDTLNSHFGFYIWAFMVLALILPIATEDGAIEIPLLVVIIGLIGIGATVSWNTGSITTYANTPVSATLVGFQSEGYNEQSGKRRVDRHYTYVIYNTPDGDVMLRASTELAYPSQAILYKN